ncbi:MAG: hypothetical protein IJ282_02990 [Lachnospiraceae bacterium]|nr:hypothetical protein [Lachnospiraceae bacterium]
MLLIPKRKEKQEFRKPNADKVRSYAKKMELELAVELAIEDCIAENVLRDFLVSQRAEVTMVSIFEYDEERELRLIREDEREIGREIGRQEMQEENRKVQAEHIKSVISLCREFGCNDEQIVEKLMEQCHLSKEEAKTVIKAFIGCQ